MHNFCLYLGYLFKENLEIMLVLIILNETLEQHIFHLFKYQHKVILVYARNYFDKNKTSILCVANNPSIMKSLLIFDCLKLPFNI